MFPKQTRWEKKKWRDAAKGQPCTMRLPCCNGNPETTVLSHKNGAGMGLKASDYDAADMCSDCHDAYDGRNKEIDKWLFHNSEDRGEYFERIFNLARYETIVNRLRRGIVK